MSLTTKFTAAFILAAASAFTLSSAHAAPIKVAVLGGAGAGTWDLVRNQLNDDSYFDFTASLLAGAGVTSSTALAGYDVVVMGGSGHSSMEYSAATLAAVKGFLQTGKGVVSTSWSVFGAGGASGQARLDADFINPVVVSGYNFVSNGTVVMNNTTHAITNGVASIAVSGCCAETGALDAGAASLATIGGMTTVAYQEAIGRSVYLGLMYTGSTSYDNAGLRAGNGDRLLEQAVAWAGKTNEVPEPASIALLALGLAAVGVSRRRAV